LQYGDLGDHTATPAVKVVKVNALEEEPLGDFLMLCPATPPQSPKREQKPQQGGDVEDKRQDVPTVRVAAAFTENTEKTEASNVGPDTTTQKEEELVVEISRDHEMRDDVDQVREEVANTSLEERRHLSPSPSPNPLNTSTGSGFDAALGNDDYHAQRGGIAPDRYNKPSALPDAAHVGSYLRDEEDDKFPDRDQQFKDARTQAAQAGLAKKKAGGGWEVKMDHIQHRSIHAELFRKPELLNHEVEYLSFEVDLDLATLQDSDKYLDEATVGGKVNPTRREMYLSDAVFQELFQCSKEEFQKLGEWKRKQQKQKFKLW